MNFNKGGGDKRFSIFGLFVLFSGDFQIVSDGLRKTRKSLDPLNLLSIKLSFFWGFTAGMIIISPTLFRCVQRHNLFTTTNNLSVVTFPSLGRDGVTSAVRQTNRWTGRGTGKDTQRGGIPQGGGRGNNNRWDWTQPLIITTTTANNSWESSNNNNRFPAATTAQETVHLEVERGLQHSFCDVIIGDVIWTKLAHE